MPISTIEISQGAFKTRNKLSLKNAPFAQELINLFIDNAGSNYDRPTLDLFATVGSDEVIGMNYFDGRLICVGVDRKIYSIDESGIVLDITGDPLPGDNRATFTNDGQSLYIAGGKAPLKWDGVGNTTELLGGSPPDMTHITFLDGVLFGNRRIDAENNKVMQYTDVDTPDGWIGTNIFSGQADPDDIQGHVISQREIYLVGESTTEVWQNVGANPDAPYVRSFVWESGTRAAYSITNPEGGVNFLDQKRRVIRILGRQIEDLSEPVREEFADYTNVDDCASFFFSYKGSTHVVYVFPSEGKVWSVDLKNKQWTEWRGFNNGWIRPQLNVLFYVKSQDTTYAADHQTGRVWKLSETVKTEAGGIFKRQRTFSHKDNGAKIRKQANGLKLNVDRSVTEYEGTPSQINPTVELRWKDDNKDWSEYRQGRFGEVGNNRDYIDFRRLGIYRNRQYEMQISDPVDFTLNSIETDEEILSD